MKYNKFFKVEHKPRWWKDSEVKDSEIVFPVKLKII